ncbi:endonuclease/exonuclease/phosphatase family protein [Enterococcus canintestini]|uniref:Hydrolase n=1 Tax=Enterococcus canintestini TaxID=317010 RepID=A0A267HUP1_9ENTE|nr:endonuclease/exonuclease/phosphatase family protein [Enterococcus canintestini]PAB01233.1 hydrolase [Enterococcus canintestini]
MKKWFKIILAFISIFLVVIIGYLGYVFLSYHRIPDNQNLTVKTRQTKKLATEKSYRALTYNIGYASYPPTYSFFMDGGTQSRADSKGTIYKNLGGITKTVKAQNPDFIFYQEVDETGDRSYHVNEVNFLQQKFGNYNTVYGVNYDSPYLFYPFTQPIGKTKSGLVTLSKSSLTNAKRYQLPIDTGVTKILDYDRAFTVTRSPVENGKDMVVINIHLSAYTKNKAVQKAQLEKLTNFLTQEYQKDNYVLVAGDFNHDILGNAPTVFGTTKEPLTWTHPFPKDQLPPGFHIPTENLATAKIPSARNLNEPYKEGKTFVTLIDGFIVSDNIAVKNVAVVNTSFAYSDHNPVTLDFQLKK